jgi:pimeloyl-ACP methyl ester carboxylesterase
MATATVNGQRLHFVDTGGTGPAVVLSHGFLMDHTMFASQIEALAPDYRVVAWDERGFGATGWDGAPFTYWDSARDCLGLMDHLGIREAVLAGMSQGGFISLRAALLAPERVRAIVLIDSGSDVDDDATLAAYRGMVDTWMTQGPIPPLAEAVATIIIAEPAENARWIAKWQTLPREALAAAAECLLGREDLTGRLGEITCPVQIIHGTADTAITMARAEKTRAGLRGAEPIVAIEGAAHAANLTHPHLVNPPLRDFLRRVTR